MFTPLIHVEFKVIQQLGFFPLKKLGKNPAELKHTHANTHTHTHTHAHAHAHAHAHPHAHD